MSDHKVSFSDTAYPPQLVSEGMSLSEELTASNSPLLFGCRTGICGTCIVEVEGDIPPADEDEQEILDIYADGNPALRLACQINVTCPIHITVYSE